MTPPPDPHLSQGEARLREALPPLADEGFTNHVLAALPPPVRKTSSQGRFVFAAGGALLGCLLVAAQTSHAAGTLPDFEHLTAMIAPLLAPWFDPMMWLALGTASASVVYAFWSRPERRSRN